ncbi:Phosphatidylinositol 4,5-bisphosphate 3-kinase catalytic subunit alpha isoform [Sorochytrium milnesiophthora]
MASLLSARRKKSTDADAGRPASPASQQQSPSVVNGSSGTASPSSPSIDILDLKIEVAHGAAYTYQASLDTRFELLFDQAYNRLATELDRTHFRLVNEYDKDVDLSHRLSESNYVAKCRKHATVPTFRLVSKESRRSLQALGSLRQSVTMLGRQSMHLFKGGTDKSPTRRSSLGNYQTSPPMPPASSVPALGAAVLADTLRGEHHQQQSRKTSGTISLFSLRSRQESPRAAQDKDADTPLSPSSGSAATSLSSVLTAPLTAASTNFLPLTIQIPSTSMESTFTSPTWLNAEAGITLSDHDNPDQAQSAQTATSQQLTDTDAAASQPLPLTRQSSDCSTASRQPPADQGEIKIRVIFPQGFSTHIRSPVARKVRDLTVEAIVQAKDMYGEGIDVHEVEVLDTNGEVLDAEAELRNCTTARSLSAATEELVVRIAKKRAKSAPEDVLDSVLNVISIYSQFPDEVKTAPPVLQHDLLPLTIPKDGSSSSSKLSAPTSPGRQDPPSPRGRTKPRSTSTSSTKSKTLAFLRGSLQGLMQSPSGQASSSSILENLPNLKFVRVELPQDAASNIPLSDGMTMGYLVEKCQLKMKRLGISLPKESIRMLVSETNEEVAWETELRTLAYVEQCLVEGVVPVFRLICSDPALLSNNASKSTCAEEAPMPVREGNLMASHLPVLSSLKSETLSRAASAASNDTIDSTNGLLRPAKSTIVRLMLPRSVITNVLIASDMNVAALKMRGLAKVRTLIGEVWENANIVISIEDHTEGLADDVILSELPYVREALKAGRIPVLNVRQLLPPPGLAEKKDVDAWSRTDIAQPGSPSSASAKSPVLERRRSRSEAPRRTRLITPEDVVRDIQIFDGPAAPRRSSLIPQSQLSPAEASSTAGSPGSATPDVAMLSRKRHRPASLNFIAFQGTSTLKLTAVVPPSLHNSPTDATTYSVQLSVSSENTIKQLKETLWQQPDFPQLPQPPEQYILRYKHPERDRYVLLLDEGQVLQTIALIESQKASALTLFLDCKRQDTSTRSQQLNKKIATIISFKLQQHELYKDPEAEQLRQRLNNVCLDAQLQGKVGTKAHVAVDKSPLSAALVDLLASKRFSVKFRVHLQFVDPVMKTLSCDEQYTLKVNGMEDYLDGDTRLIDHTYVRAQLLSGQTLSFTVAAVPILTDEDGIPVDDHYIEEAKTTLRTHAELTLRGRDLSDIKWMSLWDLTMNLRVEITKAENIDQLQQDAEVLFVEAGMYVLLPAAEMALHKLTAASYSAFGGQYISPLVRTHQVQMLATPRWHNFVIFDIPIYNIPKNARLCLTLYGRSTTRKRGEVAKDTDNVVLGGASVLLIDHVGQLRQGAVTTKLFPKQSAPLIGPCNIQCSETVPYMQIRFEEYTHPVVFPKMIELDTPATALDNVASNEGALIEEVLLYDPLVPLDEAARAVVWNHRHRLKQDPKSLPKILMSAKWDQLEDVIEVRSVLRQFKQIPPETALQLLDYWFEDDAVRAFAVHSLDQLSDADLLDYLIQLVQALKYEPRMDSELARFLLTRALKCDLIGHHLFWALKAEMHLPAFTFLFGLFVESYLKGSPRLIDDISTQSALVLKLLDTAQTVKNARSTERRELLVSMLSGISFSTRSFVLPLNSKVLVSEIIPAQSKVMDSKKLPLWVVFKPLDFVQPVHVLFKSGDDLRQDMLTLQMIRIMDKLWKASGLDLRMTLYRCICTGKDMGFIEVVLESATVCSIQLAHGGSTAAFKEDPLEKWLRQHNPSEEEFARAVETFTLSCAGYCVATYCLGIGDRHNDNIMCSKQGKLFHIDFGHFLGNTKRKFGIKRERAPFVLTPDFVCVICKGDQSKFDRFVGYCIKAYLVVRRHADVFISLFMLMLSTGIPELQNVSDLQYLRDAFCLGVSEEEAADEFRSLIYESIRLGWSTQLNWWVHNLVHGR